MKKTFLYLTSLLLLLGNSFAQTGPGGVGTNTNNKLWFTASSLSMGNGSLITTWTDISGNSKNLVAPFSYARPTFLTNQINGFPAISFSTNDELRTPSVAEFSSNPNISYVFVMKSDNASQVSSYLTNSFSNNSGNIQSRLHGGYLSGTSNLGYTRTNAGSIAFSNFTNNTSYIINSMLVTSNSLVTYTNNTMLGNVNIAMRTPATHNFFGVGRRPFFNDQAFEGKFAEIIVFDQTINTTQLNLINNYLSSKYSIAIANDFYALEGTGHYFNVTGIGMEGGNSVTDAEGRSGVQISNPSSLSNNDYLLWGHDNSSLTVNSTNVPAEFADFGGTRLNRTWAIDETNDVGTVTVTIDMNSMPSLGASTNDYVLIIDDDGDFSNGGTTYHSLGYSFASGIATWTGVDFPDGSYFTVAYVPAIFSITTGNWNTAATWNCNCVPTSADKPVYISAGDIVTVDAASSVSDLDIISTGTLSTTANNTLTITGNLSGAGTLTSTNGTINMNGSTAQTISVTSAQFFGLTINNAAGVSVTGGTHAISTVLTVTSGNFDVGTNLVTLSSISSKTARIAPSNGTISGTMIVQRFIFARSDGYSDMSSPVTSATFAEWDDDIELIFVPYVEYVSTPSIWGYDESIWDYVAIENSSDPIVPGVGYETYLDNDGFSFTSFASTIVDISGTPNMGDVAVNVTVDNDGWNLIGNPYASHISWPTFRTSAGVAMNSTFMFYDENIQDFGSASSGTIAQSQGFWVEATAAGTATFHESDKSTSTSSTFRAMEEQLLTLRVSSEQIKYTSNTQFRFDQNATLAYERDHDLSFLKVPAKNAPSLFTNSNDGRKLRINELPGDESMVIPVTFIPGVSGQYSISAINLESAFNEEYSQIILEDKLLSKFYDLTLGDYVFDANLDDNENRFNLHLKSAGTSNLLSNNEEVNFINSAQGVFVNFNLDENKSALINVFNVAGQEIINSQKVYTDNKLVGINLPSDYQGMYIIRVIIDEKVVTQRFYKN